MTTLTTYHSYIPVYLALGVKVLQTFGSLTENRRHGDFIKQPVLNSPSDLCLENI